MRTALLILAGMSLLPSATLAQQSANPEATGQTSNSQPTPTRKHDRVRSPARHSSASDSTKRSGTIGTGQVGSGATTTTTPDTVAPAGATLGQPGTGLGTGSTATTSEAASTDNSSPR